MSPRSFPLFSRLPPEIREAIWKFTVRPRLVFIEETTTARAHHSYMAPEESHELFSNCLIPYTLHTCRESRATMIKCGYVLAFGTQHQRPSTWFNFKCDMLHLQDDLGGGHINTLPGDPANWFFERFSLEDASRVTKIAMGGSLSSGANFGNFISYMPSHRALCGLLKYFGGIEEFLVVETIHGKGSSHRYFPAPGVPRNVLVEWVDCDVAEALGYCSPEGDVVTFRYKHLILDYKRKNRSDGEDFFRQLAAKLERELRGLRNQGVREGRKSWSIPDFRIVQIMSVYSSWRMRCNRDVYWAQLFEKERMEAEELARPLSPFSAEFEEELDVIRFGW